MSNSDRRELMIRAAWYYHFENMTQSEIAERLDLTRRRVNEMLSEAMDTGIVTVKFNAEMADCVELEDRLCDRFGLEAAVVAPTPRDPALLHGILGKAAADYFQRKIATSRATRIGVGWGATLRELIRSGSQMKLPDAKVYSVIGGLPHGAEINTFETVRGIANLLGGECEYLIAPVYTETPEARNSLRSQDFIRDMFAKLQNLELVIVSVGDVTGESLQIKYGLPAGTTAESLKRAGAVGDIIGRYLDRDGRPVDHPLKDLVIAPELDEFARIPSRIIASGGRHKHEIMRACAEAGYATAFVTDAECAGYMLRI